MADEQPVVQDPPEAGWIVKAGGRKFLVSTLSLLLVVFFVPVDGDAKLGFITSVVGIFAGANVVQKAVLGFLGGKPGGTQ